MIKPKFKSGYHSATEYFGSNEEFTLVTGTPREKRAWNAETKSYSDTVDSYIYSFAYTDCDQVIDVKFKDRQQMTQFAKYYLKNLEVFEDFTNHKVYFRAEDIESVML